MADTVPGFAEIGASSEPGTISSIFCGVPAQALASNNLLDLPDAVHFAVSDLFTQDVQCVGYYTSTGYFNFKSSLTQQQQNSTIAFGDSVRVNPTTSTVSVVDYKDSTRSVGGNAWCIYLEGFPAYNATALEVEYIYHLEGMPLIGQSSTIPVPVASTAPAAVVGSTAIVENAMAAVAPSKAITSIRRITSFLNKPEVKAVGKAALSLASLI